MAQKFSAALILVLFVCARGVFGDDETHTYTSEEEVILWINRIGKLGKIKLVEVLFIYIFRCLFFIRLYDHSVKFDA